MRKSILLALAMVTFGQFALASDISFNLQGFESKMNKGVKEVTIYTLADGKLLVQIDPNQCSPGGGCTEIPLITQAVTPTVIRDNRPTDGSLLLKLTDALILEVGSGYNIEGKITYTAILTGISGKTERLPLDPVVQTIVVPEYITNE